MGAASICLLSLALIALQTIASDPKRQIGDHPGFGISPLQHRRVSIATSFHDPGHKRGLMKDESQVHSRPVRTVPKKYYKSKRYRVTRDAKDVLVQIPGGEEESPQLPLQLPQEYLKEQQSPGSPQGAPEDLHDKEENEEEAEQLAGDRRKVIPTTPLFVNAKYQLQSRKVPQGPIILQHPVDPRLYEQNHMLARPLNKSQLLHRIHKDNQNINPDAESTTAVNEETCPDGEDPEAEWQQPKDAQEGYYNRTGLLSKPNYNQEVHKDSNRGANFSKRNLYGLNLSVVPSSTIVSPSSMQQIHQMQQTPGMQQARSQVGLYSQPSEGWQQPPVEEATKTTEKK